MLLGYNTNGFAHHRLEDAVAILADLGYGGVAFTLDHGALNPYDAGIKGQLAIIGRLLQDRGLRSVVETGARFLLDPWRKHQPTLLSADPSGRERRLDFLRRSIDIAAELRADAVSFWSGAPDDNAPFVEQLNRLVEGCLRVCDYAEARAMPLAFEPEPGMLIDTMERFAALAGRVDHPLFGLTIDVGHLHCQGEIPIADHLRHWRGLLRNVHVEDMRRGVHDHLMFGEGEIDFGPVLTALDEIGYGNGVYVELSRHSHNAVETARRAMAFLRN